MKRSLSLYVRNIGHLLTMVPGQRGIDGAAVVIRDGEVEYAGPESDVPRDAMRHLPSLDAAGGLVAPGFVECHTHLVFAGSRADEFEARALGLSYEEIARGGGGIRRTVLATRLASRDELFDLAVPRVRRLLAQGVTTIEVKSGYGLNLESERKILEVVRDLDLACSIDLVPTFLGAHAVPFEARDSREAHVDAICQEWIPAVAEAGLARFCDVFCESVAFTVDECRRVLEAGLAAGLRPKVHGEQLGRYGGARLAAEFHAASCDHLDHADARDREALAAAGVTGVLLPGCAVSLCKPRFPSGRALRDAGVAVALSTDFNPGSSVTLNLPLMGTFAMAFMGLTLAETWEALTCNAAAALDLGDRIGRLAPGYAGDLTVFHSPDPRDPFYDYGGSGVAAVVKRGRLAVRRSTDGEVSFL